MVTACHVWSGFWISILMKPPSIGCFTASRSGAHERKEQVMIESACRSNHAGGQVQDGRDPHRLEDGIGVPVNVAVAVVKGDDNQVLFCRTSLGDHVHGIIHGRKLVTSRRRCFQMSPESPGRNQRSWKRSWRFPIQIIYDSVVTEDRHPAATGSVASLERRGSA